MKRVGVQHTWREYKYNIHEESTSTTYMKRVQVQHTCRTHNVWKILMFTPLELLDPESDGTLLLRNITTCLSVHLA